MTDFGGAEYLGLAVTLGILGGLVMTVMPIAWHSWGGWAAISYLLVPGAIICIALLVNAPFLIVGVAFLLGFLARQ